MPVEGKFCDGCVQQPFGEAFVGTDGLGTSGILLVGDSPWVDEIRAQLPFAGAAGAMLNRIIRRLGMERQDFLIENALHCKPRHLGWTDHPERFADAALALTHCRPYLDETIARFKPKVIVTLGTVALQRVCGVGGLRDRHAYVHDSSYGIPVVPTWHPSFLLKGNHNLTGAVLFAFRRALEVADRKLVRPQHELVLDPSLADAEAYFRRVNLSETEVVCDIETPESGALDEEEAEGASFTIVRIGFSHTPLTAISMPWTEPYIGLSKRVLKQAQRTLFWNVAYDLPRLQAAGCVVSCPTEAWNAWHYLQSDLPKALGFVAPFFSTDYPWKHLADADPARYNALDCLHALNCWRGASEALKRQGRWDVFVRHCLELEPLLAQMGTIRVDKQQQQEFRAKLEAEAAEAYRKLQQVVPLAVKPRKVYRKLPKGVGATELKAEEVECPRCGKQEALVE